MKIEISVRTNRVGSDDREIIEIDDEDLEGLDDRMRAKTINAIAFEHMLTMVSWDYEEVS